MPIVKFDTVSIEFAPENYGLRDVSFDIEPGEVVYITGPSGSGKTTLMRLLTKEYNPTSGEVYFNDEPIGQIGKGQVHHHRRRIGVVFQDYRLIPEMNVWENIALPLSVLGKSDAETESRVTDLLNLIKLPEKAFQFPSQLSGGEAQRVSIARALAMGPEVIFADEPTGNLDPVTSQSIAKLLHKVNQLGTTVLIATHDQTILQQNGKHRVIKLENGLLLEDGGKKISVKEKKAQNKSEQTEVKGKEVVEDLPPTHDEPEGKSRLPKPKKPSVWSSIFKKKSTDESQENPVAELEDSADPEKKEVEKKNQKKDKPKQDASLPKDKSNKSAKNNNNKKN